MINRCDLLFVAALLAIPISSYGSDSATLSPCDLMNNPAKYNKQTIQVRGRVLVAFENFSLATSECDGEGKRWIWLTYGGDEPTPIMSTVNDQERRPGSAPSVDGKPVLLRRNKSLELFKNRLAAQRIGRPGENSCYDRACYLYDVTATITGVFLAAPKDFRRGGYGHLGCCHLLIIQAVDALDAKRTPVPAGGQFTCTKDVWNVDAATARSLQRQPCHNFKDCQIAVAEQLAKVAAHWGDTINPSEGTTFGALEGYPRWESNDFTKAYSFHYTYKAHASGETTGAEATRASCHATSPPFPQNVPISCRNLWSDFDVTRQQAKAVVGTPEARPGGWRMGGAEKASRTALEDAALRWGVNLAPGIGLSECSKPSVVQGDQFTWCTWSDPNAMQTLTVQLTRFGHLRESRKWDTAPWILTRGYGIDCSPDSK